MNIPPRFRQPIKVTYPPNNTQLFEEWFMEQWYARSMQFQCNTDRELLPLSFTANYVNNNYGNDREFLQALQVFLDDLPRDKKYFCIVQYDDGILNNVSGIDLLQFSMSKNIGVPMPLLCKPQTHRPKCTNKRFLFSFVGSRTHPIRDIILEQKNKYSNDGELNPYLTCMDSQMPIEQYIDIIAMSMYGLCPRGYGLNSFRIAECIQYGTIPVYISDEFVEPFNCDFNEYGVKVSPENAHRVHEILYEIPPEVVIKKQDKLKSVYKSTYTYDGAFKNIINYLENEAAYS